MESIGSLPCLNTGTVRPESSVGNSEVLMIDCLSIGETDRVNHTVEIGIVKLVVEIESYGMSADELDKKTGSSNGLQPKQADLSCVHALNKPHFHEIRVVLSKHEADQYNSEYFFGIVTPFSSIEGHMSGPFSTDSRIIRPCCLFVMYSSIMLFQESYISFSSIGRKHALSFMRPFRHLVIILDTLDHLVNVVRSSVTTVDPGRERAQKNEFESMFGQDKDANGNSTYRMFNPISVVRSSYDIRIFSGAYDDEVKGAVADFSNLELTTAVSPILTIGIHKDHPKEQIIGDPLSAPQTRRMTKTSPKHAMVYRNKKDKRGLVVRNKARLVTQGHTQEEGIDYDEVFAPVVRIDAQEVLDEFYRGAHFLLRVAVKTTSAPIETIKALLKDEEDADVDVNLYKSMIGSLMYLTTSKPNIMFVVYACARDSPFDLEAFLDSDYAGASLHRKFTTGGCQFIDKRLISWRCKKKIVVVNSTTEAQYVAAAN
nr:ribonuclease H-like domain, reverse transcriptase, RNA-dependent DNA polymerase [Tanacetum cinerariifolium]